MTDEQSDHDPLAVPYRDREKSITVDTLERPDEPLFAPGEQYQVTGRSVLLFVLQHAGEDRGRPERRGVPEN